MPNRLGHKVGVAITFIWAYVLSGNALAASELRPCTGTSLVANLLLLSNLVESPCFGDLW